LLFVKYCLVFLLVKYYMLYIMKNKSTTKIISAIALGTAIAYTLWQYPIGRYLPILIDWILNQGLIGYIVYISVFAIGTAMFFPGSIFVMGAGYIWGIAVGSIVASISLTLSAAIAFIFGRYIARDWIANKVSQSQKLGKLDVGVANSGFKIIFLIRLSPIFPFTLFNYAYGSTGVKFRNYILGTWLGMIPGTVMYVYFGSFITEIAQVASGQSPFSDGINYYKTIGFIISVAVTIIIAKFAHRTLSREY